MSRSRRAAPGSLSGLIRNRAVRAAFETADETYGDEGMSGLKPGLGLFSGGKMPSALAREYLILLMMAQSMVASKIRIEHGIANQLDRSNVESVTRTCKLWNLDTRDFGFGDITEFDVEVALANEDADWPCRRR